MQAVLVILLVSETTQESSVGGQTASLSLHARNILYRILKEVALFGYIHVLVGLRVLSKGNFLSEVADLHGISKQTASRVLHEFVDAVNRNIDNIRFQRTQQELAEAKLGFYKRCKIANIVGAVDGTLVPIIAPKDSGEAYICRKGFHAINVMATCSHDRRFIDIVAKWPGSQHDSSVMNTSSLKEHMESERPGMLLADSGYPLTNSLLTPLANPVTPAEARYNNAQSKGRMVIEQSFGILKGRFRCVISILSPYTSSNTDFIVEPYFRIEHSS
ncbi:putative nuclease HARBI1 isoform X3 [Mya arenaria]|uniref:putative nuclease HARBI1 isoform X3 n=1 Tax=Mya arenaria TaxID=6604 RepID=UPI0022DEA2A6|nr:putative nuclease HARBI1 isoform X3 [Mya arenaria]